MALSKGFSHLVLIVFLGMAAVGGLVLVNRAEVTVEPESNVLAEVANANLLSNPGFESDLQGWSTQGSVSVSTANKHGGAKSLEISNIGQGAEALQTFTVTAGMKYKLSSWIKTESVSGNSASAAIIWRGSSGNFVGYDSVGRVTGTADWANHEGTFTAPSGASTAVVGPSLDPAGSGKAWFDDLSFALVSTGTPPPPPSESPTPAPAPSPSPAPSPTPSPVPSPQPSTSTQPSPEADDIPVESSVSDHEAPTPPPPPPPSSSEEESPGGNFVGDLIDNIIDFFQDILGIDNQTNPTPPSTASSLPLCPTHDATAWHSLVDSVQQCHYDHEHGDDPHLGDAIFGPWGASWGGQQISYPWATSAVENTHKHGGYKFFVKTNFPCDPNFDFETIKPINCLKAVRLQSHIVPHALDGLARYHSHYLEAQVCKYPNYTDCGVFRTGGWVDFGLLMVPYAGFRVCRPGGTLDFGMGSTYGGGNSQIVMNLPPDAADLNGLQSCGGRGSDQPYAALPTLADLAYFTSHPPQRGHGMDFWTSSDLDGRFGANPYEGFSISVFDSWGLVDPTDPNKLHWLCRDGSCNYNGSLRTLFSTQVRIPKVLDTDGDGFADSRGYTSKLGQIASSCTTPSLDCVPISTEHAPVGVAAFTVVGDGGPPAVEYDTSPPGERWIKFPN